MLSLHAVIGMTIAIVALIVILLCIKKVLADRPYIGLKTSFGRRTKKVYGPGYHLIAPWSGFLPIYVEIRNQTIVAEAYSKVDDRIKFIFKVNVHWLPDSEMPGELENYILAGGTVGVLDFKDEKELERLDQRIRQKIEDMVKEVIKNFASTHVANECLNVKDEIYKSIIQRMTGIVDEVKLAAKIKKFKGDERLKLVEKWGIVVDSVNVEPVHPTPKMEEVMQQKAKEDREREAEGVEIDNENDQVKKIMQAASATGIDPEKFMTALRLVKDYKTVREGHGFVIPGRTKSSSGAVDDLLQLAGAFINKNSSGKSAVKADEGGEESGGDSKGSEASIIDAVRVRRKKDGK